MVRSQAPAWEREELQAQNKTQNPNPKLEGLLLDTQQLKTRYLTANFIGLALIVSVFIYAVVVQVLKWTLAPFSGFAALAPGQAQVLKYIFVALAIGHFFLIKLVQKIMAAGTAERLFQTAVITFALSEAVAIFGLVLFLLTGNSMDFYLFMFLSLFYFWFFYPKYQDWETQLRAQSPPRARGASKS
jgi:F0F1-type ATP synthase membrane subunit c/vacuolar-type H+-ATPase subunit K